MDDSLPMERLMPLVDRYAPSQAAVLRDPCAGGEERERANAAARLTLGLVLEYAGAAPGRIDAAIAEIREKQGRLMDLLETLPQQVRPIHEKALEKLDAGLKDLIHAELIDLKNRGMEDTNEVWKVVEGWEEKMGARVQALLAQAQQDMAGELAILQRQTGEEISMRLFNGAEIRADYAAPLLTKLAPGWLGLGDGALAFLTLLNPFKLLKHPARKIGKLAMARAARKAGSMFFDKAIDKIFDWNPFKDTYGAVLGGVSSLRLHHMRKSVMEEARAALERQREEMLADIAARRVQPLVLDELGAALASLKDERPSEAALGILRSILPQTDREC